MTFFSCLSVPASSLSFDGDVTSGWKRSFFEVKDAGLQTVFYSPPFKQHWSFGVEFERETEVQHIKKVTSKNVITGLGFCTSSCALLRSGEKNV